MNVIIIGAGPGGIAMGKRLKDAGLDDFVILEKASGVGGSWWNNRYPGCRCDVPSHLYSFSFALKKDWTEPFAAQGEIQRYMEECVEEFGLGRHIRLDTEVVDARWDEGNGTWTVTTESGGKLTANVLVGAMGLFNLPAIPPIEGLERFQGTVMHSATWDADVLLEGKRVAVIGSGASAVQIIPSIACIVGHLDSYQRSPAYVMPREEFFEEGKRERLMSDPNARAEERQQIWDWLEEACELKDEMLAEMKASALKNLEVVKDPDTRRRLVPDYPIGSKRSMSSNEFYPTFNRPNVSLVTDPIAWVDRNAIVTADGTGRETDVIVFATGFQTTRFMSAIPVVGRNGAVLSDVWASGARAYLGITVPQFPNMFMLYGPNTNNGSIITQIESQVDYVIRKLEYMQMEGIASIDLKPEALEHYNAWLQDDIAKMKVWQTGNTHDYYRAENGLVVTQWPHSMARYREETSRDDNDSYVCLEADDATGAQATRASKEAICH